MHTACGKSPHDTLILLLFIFASHGLGTPFYVAPDILMAADDDDAGYGPPVDMWAVGVLLYILLRYLHLASLAFNLSGRLPFSGDEDDELFKNILEAKIVWKSPQFEYVELPLLSHP